MQADEQGKVRVRPHAAGSWACHVYLTTMTPPQDWTGVVEEGRVRLQSLFPGVRAESTLHVSLSKTFYAKHWQLEPLVGQLRDRLAGRTMDELTLDRWAVYENDEGTRSFLALDCQATSWLAGLVEAVDGVLAGYGFAPFYQVPGSHRWC